MAIINDILTFFRKAIPVPVNKNFHTQLGVHFEEVNEMLQELRSDDETTKKLIAEAAEANHNLAVNLKSSDHVVMIVNDVNYLDALCDQVVTAVGCGYMVDYDMIGALDEVATSNLSKFDKNGNPIFDENQKVMKGPLYFKAKLLRFVSA